MKRIIELEKTNIEYTVRSSARARSLRLAVFCDGNVVVTAPGRIAESAIEHFVHQKSKWITDTLGRFRFAGFRPYIKRTRKDYLKYKEQARVLVSERVVHYNTFYNFPVKDIRIRDQKTRWGSCSKKGNLNFNYKIALLPLKLVDYIVIHELCHLGEFNHSQKFWNLVARTMPNYISARRELKRVGKSV